MKPFHARFLVLLILLTLVPIPFMPQAAADYSWTQITAFELGESAEGSFEPIGDWGAAIPMGSTALAMTIVGNDAANSQTYVVYKCSLTSCPSNSGIGGTTAGSQSGGHISKRTDTDAYGCTTRTGGSSDNGFAKTSNAGALWSTTTFSASDPKSCDVATFDGSHYAYVWGNGTTDDWVVTMSSDGGATWPVTYLIEADTGPSLGPNNGVAVVAFSDTEYVAIINDPDTSNFNQCKTSNSGVTWTCTANVITGATEIQKEKFGTGYYFSWSGRQNSDFAGFGFLASFEDSISGTNAYSVSSGTTGVCASDVGVYSATRAAVSFLLCNSASASQVLKLAETFDGGGSWEVSEIATIPCRMQVDYNGNTGVAYIGDRLFTSFSFSFLDDSASCGGADGDGIPERYFIAYASSGGAGEEVAFADSVAATDLNGFALDPSGEHIITRQDNGDTIKFYAVGDLSGGPLNTGVNQISTNCDLDPAGDVPGNKGDGVLIQYGGNLGAFINCDVNGDPEFLSIRETDGSNPEPSDFEDQGGEPCDDTDTCPFNISLSNFEEPCVSAMDNMDQVLTFPISFRNNLEERAGGADRRQVAWGFTTRDPDAGKIGMASFTGKFPMSNSEHCATTPFSVGSEVTDMCVGLDESTYYLAGAGGGANTRTYPVTFDTDTAPDESLTSELGTAAVISGTGDGAGIACGGGRILIQRNNAAFIGEIWYAGRDATDIKKLATLTNTATSRSVALSEMVFEDEIADTCTEEEQPDGCVQYGAWVDYDAITGDGTLYVANMFNSTAGAPDITCTLPFSELGFFDVAFTRNPNTLVMAFEDLLARVDVQAEGCTTEQPIGIPSDDDGDGGGGGGNDPGDPDALFRRPQIEGVSTFGQDMIAAIFCMGFFMGSFGTIPTAVQVYEGRRLKDAVTFDERLGFVGLIIGFGLAWGVGYLNIGAVFVMGTMAALLVGSRWFKVRNQS